MVGMFAALPAGIPHVKQNRLRGLGVSSQKPVAALPGVPTIAETVKGYEVVLWWGVFGPKGMSRVKATFGTSHAFAYSSRGSHTVT